MLFPKSLPIAPPISVEISTSGSLIVGESYTLMCFVTGVESLNATINFEWRDNYWNLVSSNAVLTFSPLLFSHGGHYTCRVTVSSPYLENVIVSSAMEVITFEGMQILHECMA